MSKPPASSKQYVEDIYPHLWKSRYGIYYFRITVPKDQRALSSNGKKSFKRSLKTRCPKDALRKARALWALHFGDKEAVSTALAQSRSTISWINFPISPGLDQFRSGSFHDMHSAPSDPLSLPSQRTKMLLSEAISLFLKEGTTGNNWTQKTAGQHSATLSIMMEHLGERPLQDINRQDIIELRERLKERPIHLNKRIHLRRDKNPKALSSEERLSVSTINNILTRVHTFFSWAQRNEFTDRNPAQRIKLKDDVHPRDKRAAYTVQDLQALLNGYERFRKYPPHPYQYWLPLLGMYTGARLEELCQLHLSDIIEIDGVWCISINNEGEKKIKTRSSLRVVPIHSELIQNGFLDFVADCKRRDKRRLFTELRRKRDGYHPQASKWFNEKFKRHCALTAGKKDFHSFRHTVADFLKQKHISKERVAALLGHSDGSETFDRYGKAYLPEGMKDVVEALDYELCFDPIHSIVLSR